ncbi:MAG: FHA domain-containing protein [Christensenellaceae bacterium]|jgi:hypothetical protein|nr:FHA domain-containing protein [Christensenellaceae bacterium]
MKLQRCPYGHYYDPAKYQSCPHCAAREDAGVTMALREEREESPAYESVSRPAPLARDEEGDEAETRALYAEEVKTEPAVGFLVCVKGPARGQDFRLHAQRNTIGRGSRMDVSVKGDLGISREMNAVISYNPRSRQFHLMAGEGKPLVYLNGDEVLQPRQLQNLDTIEIGETTLAFYAVCGPHFDWDAEQQREKA